MVLVHFSGEEVAMASDSPARSLDEIDLSALRVSRTFSDFSLVVWVSVNGLGVWTEAGGQRRADATRGGGGWWNLESLSDLGTAEVLSAVRNVSSGCGQKCPRSAWSFCQFHRRPV